MEIKDNACKFVGMELFYAQEVDGAFCRLDAEESGHCVRVLRHRAGDEIDVIDGLGTLYHCRLTDDSPKGAEAQVLQVQADHLPPFAAEFAFLVALARFADPDGHEIECAVTVRDLATGLSERIRQPLSRCVTSIQTHCPAFSPVRMVLPLRNWFTLTFPPDRVMLVFGSVAITCTNSFPMMETGI